MSEKLSDRQDAIQPQQHDVKIPDHPRRVNCAGRQICCTICHQCGCQMRTVLDGEHWCDTCQTYA